MLNKIDLYNGVPYKTDEGIFYYVADVDETIKQLKAENEKREQELIEALSFYADPDTYFAIGFFPDSPCGDFIDDFDEMKKPGAKARAILKDYASRIEASETKESGN